VTESFEVKCPNGHLFSMTKLQLIKLARDSGAVFLLAPLIAGDATLIASASRRRSQSPRFMTCTSRANTYAVVRKSPGKQSAKR